MIFFSENSQQTRKCTFLRKSAFSGGILLFLRKFCHFGTHCAKRIKTNRFLGVLAPFPPFLQISIKFTFLGAGITFFAKAAFLWKRAFLRSFCDFGVKGAVWGTYLGMGSLMIPYIGVPCIGIPYIGIPYIGDSLYRESLYKESLYRDSLYSDPLYRGFPIYGFPIYRYRGFPI